VKRIFFFLAVACAPTASRTIEPTIEPGSHPPDDSSFVLSRGGAKIEPVSRADFPVHLEEKWWPFRAEHLAITADAAKARDAKMSNQKAPESFWDEQTAIEAVSIWSALCNECHGGRRMLKDARSMNPPPPGWGSGEGLFFGRSRPYAEIFGIIFNGGPDKNGVPSEMPKWGSRISKEQIWSLIYFVEYQSGGVKGQFPPSLYPRRPADM
jgi:hypothetical protein